MSISSSKTLLVIASLLSQLWFMTSQAQSVLTEAEQNDLQFMREEEKLSRDVYNRLFEIWGSPLFSSIAISEQRHMDAVLNLLNKYTISDPAAGNACLLYTSPSPRDQRGSRMPSSA